MRLLLTKIRSVIYILNIFIATGIFLYIYFTTSSSRLEIIHLTQTYAFYSTILLYIALLASPLYSAFPYLPTKTFHITARKAIGNSAFFFALLHTLIAFFFQLGGFYGLLYLNNNYLLSISLSFAALVILSIMFVTSFSHFITKLGKRWKTLHRFVYVATFFILIHALMLGTHFSNTSGLIPQIFIYALSVLLVLESFRFDKYIASRFRFPRYTFFVLGVCIIGLIGYQLVFNITDQSFSVHAQHTKGQQSTNGRFTVNFLDTQVIEPGKNVTLRFQIYDNETKQPLNDLAVTYDKVIHMIVVDNSLSYFVHLHPIRDGSEFLITTSFPKSDLYHIYFNYQPIGFQEQVSNINLQVGNTSPSIGAHLPDKSLTKTFGEYSMSLQTNGGFNSANMNAGIEFLTFTIKDANTGQPVTNLSPYLGAFGHLVMINENTYDYIHVHPNGLTPANQSARSGPDVHFIPLAINTRVTPGIYRLFSEFKRNGKLFLTDFTVKIN